MKSLVLSVVIGMCLSAAAQAKSTSIFPKNNKWIGIGFVDDGISEADFNVVLDKIVKIYDPIVQKHGYKLDYERLWSDGTVNSDTTTEGDTWIINAYGGLARYKGMTMDGYAGVACHELGHHLGGAPQFSDGGGMSVEGESDYHVGAKCLHKYFADDDNIALMAGKQIDPLVIANCSAAYVGDAANIALCERSSLAGFVIADILRDLEGSATIAFNTPDNNKVSQTDEEHPAAQCRLDTYFASALCTVSPDIEFSDTDATVGACMDGMGARPQCWFAK
jgi:hypothetical protein